MNAVYNIGLMLLYIIIGLVLLYIIMNYDLPSDKKLSYLFTQVNNS
jgi:hypothetical protein